MSKNVVTPENAEAMAKVRELMAKADQVNLGGDLMAGVDIDFVTDFGTHIKGNVIFKRPTMLDYVKIGALKSEYLREGGAVNLQLVDNSIKYIAQVMSVLRVVVVKCPEWLMNIDGVLEPDILYYVYNQYEVWEKSFRKLPEKRVPEDSGTTE